MLSSNFLSGDTFIFEIYTCLEFWYFWASNVQWEVLHSLGLRCVSYIVLFSYRNSIILTCWHFHTYQGNPWNLKIFPSLFFFVLFFCFCFLLQMKSDFLNQARWITSQFSIILAKQLIAFHGMVILSKPGSPLWKEIVWYLWSIGGIVFFQICISI